MFRLALCQSSARIMTADVSALLCLQIRPVPPAKHLQIELPLLARNLCQSQDLARQEPKCGFGFRV